MRKKITQCVWAWLLAMWLGSVLCASSFVQLNDDVLGLIVFKSDLIDRENALASWTEDDNSPCNWTGVGCDERIGRVVSVNLDGLSLSGHMGRGLGKLAYLRNLSIANNNVSGGIPPELGQLVLLKNIDLSYNRLSGPISPALGNLISIHYLDFSHNLLSGSIPAQLFANCRGLRYLYLQDNLLEGSVPYSLGSCLHLSTMNLSSNHLMNELPSTFTELKSLTVLDLSYNSISGPLPPLSANLATLRLQSNWFSGAIGEQIGYSTFLEYVDLSNNFLTGEIPAAIRRLESLTALNLASNVITGSIPLWIGELRSLQVLNLSYNAISGVIPDSVAKLEALQTVDFSHNKLSGVIPGSFSSCPQLEVIDLSSNKLANVIPPQLLSSRLVSLKLKDNLLTGSLDSQFFSKCDSLQVLDLSRNQLSGAMPGINACSKLEYLNISSNLFSGNSPDFYKGGSITVLDLSHNKIAGSIHPSIGNSAMLSVLFMDDNSLNGSIPSTLGNCSALSELNLSRNKLTGSIPKELGNLKTLEVLDLSFNNLTGSVPSELDRLQMLMQLNVSYNMLQGSIPDTGIFMKFNASSYIGNMGLCGALVRTTCPGVMPKPIVLNPNSSSDNPLGQEVLPGNRFKHKLLSASAIIAISAAAAIFVGVVIVLFLNAYVQSMTPTSISQRLYSFSPSSSSDMPIGKLVMFTKNSDPSAEEWITTAHALLNKDSELGRGGLGTVYKAVLADGRTVAIKKLAASSTVKSQEDFEMEIQRLGNISHPNLLSLQGYYWTPSLQLLIYEFIPNGSLYSKLHEKGRGEVPLGWPTRFKIALGIAHGLAHLHHSCDPQVIHYNMKSSNVLLDEECNPKIADHGLAKLLPMLDKYLMSGKFQNALGYMAPEFACQSSKINEKCDVYGYGVMLLELVTCRRPVEYREDDVVILCDYVRALLDEGKAMSCVDPAMRDYVEEEVLPFIKLGLICTSQVPSNRPSMNEVVQILELIKSKANNRDLL